uniref:Ankyrin repeat-containing protein At3g12360 family n=1 Tax=Cajanus cajan TaxID=3821 RepID=A0A151RBS5_CAJCA|nr:Ankyrin repeat-containing protein At3g12360 family [Cajanus cajan]
MSGSTQPSTKEEKESEASIISENITHDQKDNIHLLQEVYHLAHGGALSNSQDSYFFDLTQTRTPVLGNTMLHVAACNDNNDVVDLVVKKAPELLFLRNKNEDTALHVAARAGHNLTIQKLLEAYSDFQRPEIAKEWLQFEQRNNAEGLIYLIRLENNQGNTMLHEAMMCSKCKGPNIFQVLDSYRGESVSESCYESALTKINKANQSVLYLAVETGHKDTVIHILNKCHENVMPHGISPLKAAIMKHDEDMLKIILSKKQEWIHLKDKDGRVALHYAASTGLEKCKSCSNQKDKDGSLPLHLAVAYGGDVEVVKELLKYCSDPTEMLDKSGRNILHIAAKNGKYEVLQYILQTQTRGFKEMINQKDVEGNTPLHLASKWCHPRIVYDLTWDERVNLRAVNQYNQTALDIVNEVYQSQENPSLRQAIIKGKDGVSETKIIVNCKDKGSETEPYKDRVESLQVVSTLIVTASVAACLAVPGEADGAANNIKHAMFHFFIFSITISLFSSMSATIILFWTRLGVLELLVCGLDCVLPLLGVSLISLSLAFMSGLYTVISEKTWLATTFLVISLIFVVVLSFLYILLFFPSKSTKKPLRYISFYPFLFLAWLAEPGTPHQSHNMKDNIVCRCCDWM